MLTLQRSLMVIFVVASCIGGAMLRARAAFDAQILSTTRGMLGIPDDWLRGEARTIVVNGARIRVASGRSRESLPAVLDRAEAECRRRSAGLHARAKRVADHAKRTLPSLADGILRVQNADEGLVACLDLGAADASFESLAARLSDFAKDGDLEALGGVRVLRAEAREEQAFFVTMWNEGRAPIWDMFPATGDAPGLDFNDVPRPTRARRVLSTWQEHGAPAINVYESEDPPDLTWERYTRELTRQGWLESTHDHAQSKVEYALMLIKGGKQVVITAEVQDRKTLLAVMPLDAGPSAAWVRSASETFGR